MAPLCCPCCLWLLWWPSQSQSVTGVLECPDRKLFFLHPFLRLLGDSPQCKNLKAAVINQTQYEYLKMESSHSTGTYCGVKNVHLLQTQWRCPELQKKKKWNMTRWCCQAWGGLLVHFFSPQAHAYVRVVPFQHRHGNCLPSNFSISLVSVCFLPFFSP